MSGLRSSFTSISDQRARDLRASGIWEGKTIAQHAQAAADADPDRILIIDGAGRLTAATLVAQADRLARGLVDHGLRPGDVVSYALPNWHETCVLSLAAALAGVVLNPLLPIYRDRELEFMLGDCESRMLFVPEAFRNIDYVTLTERLRPKLPHLRDVVVVRGSSDSALSYESLLQQNASAALPAVDPSAVKLLIYTSGTTGRPKGVLHSHETILADVRSLARHWSVTPQDVFFVPSPVTHIGGSLYAHEFPWYSRTPAVLLDVWSAEQAVALIDRFACTISAGATPFLKGLLEAAGAAGTQLKSLRLFICGGASVPADLIRSAMKAFPSCVACRAYGSTEVPTVTSGTPVDSDPFTCAETDGIACGTEIAILEPESERMLGAGRAGEVAVRAPEMFLGYLRPEDDAEAFTRAGFFRTGDIGQLDSAGRLTITGRKKDLIIRSGENISPKEIEDLLGAHPAVADVAVVAIPDERTGEAGCACIVVRPGASLTLCDIARFMTEKGTARQKIPEALMLLDSMPRTATGKVRKDLLREMAPGAANRLESAERTPQTIRQGSEA